MASTSAAAAAEAPAAGSEKSVKLMSNDGEEFAFSMAWIEKAVMLKTMLSDLGFNAEDEDSLPKDAIPLPSVGRDALDCIVKWLTVHAAETVRSDEDRQIHRFNRNVKREDTDLFELQTPRAKLADVINAAYYLEMPDMIDTLVKYTANNLEGKSAEEMSKWLEIPLKKDERKNPADDDASGEGESSQKRERADEPGTSQQ